MSDFYSIHGSCTSIPDDLTLAQFMLDASHTARPVRDGHSPWLIEDATGRGIGHDELRARTFGLANSLSTRWGIGERDVVCIFAANHVDYPVAIWASHRLGAVVSTANPNYSPGELIYQLKTTGSTLIITNQDSVGVAEAAARVAGISRDRIILIDHPVGPSSFSYPVLQDLIAEGLTNAPAFKERKLTPGEAKTKVAFLSFSSGTTGKPKAVAVPHYAIISNVIQLAECQKVNENYTSWDKRRFRPGDIAVAVLPFFHASGLVVNLHWLLFSGLSLVVIPKFNFVAFLKSIVRFKITHLIVVPPQAVLLCKHPAVRDYDLSHVRLCLCGAAPLSAELTQQLVKVLPNASIGQGYGLTETTAMVCVLPINQHVGTLGSVGQLLPGVVARVIKKDGSLCGYGEQGELYVAGPQNALRYTNNEQATADTFVNGMVKTGDEVIIEESGDVFVVDRLKEILKVRGFQVSPAELEGHLLGHPDVADVCVVGIPDSYSGELPLAFVILEGKAAKRIAMNPRESEILKASISKYVSDSKVRYKWLVGGIEFVNVIAKTASGKLLRRVMKERAQALQAKKEMQLVHARL